MRKLSQSYGKQRVQWLPSVHANNATLTSAPPAVARLTDPNWCLQGRSDTNREQERQGDTGHITAKWHARACPMELPRQNNLRQQPHPSLHGAQAMQKFVLTWSKREQQGHGKVCKRTREQIRKCQGQL